MQYRILGAGSAAFEVSALGFGVMGMAYNRSQFPDERMRRRVIEEAVDRGVTLFDTGIIHNSVTNPRNIMRCDEKFSSNRMIFMHIYLVMSKKCSNFALRTTYYERSS